MAGQRWREISCKQFVAYDNPPKHSYRSDSFQDKIASQKKNYMEVAVKEGTVNIYFC